MRGRLSSAADLALGGLSNLNLTQLHTASIVGSSLRSLCQPARSTCSSTTTGYLAERGPCTTGNFASSRPHNDGGGRAAEAVEIRPRKARRTLPACRARTALVAAARGTRHEASRGAAAAGRRRRRAGGRYHAAAHTARGSSRSRDCGTAAIASVVAVRDGVLLAARGRPRAPRSRLAWGPREPRAEARTA